jgi:predicted HTH domain antitoxin
MLDGNIQIKKSLSADIDEISKIIQYGYTQFMELMNDEHSNFTYANEDLKEEIMEVFEKCIISKNYR